MDNINKTILFLKSLLDDKYNLPETMIKQIQENIQNLEKTKMLLNKEKLSLMISQEEVFNKI